MYAEDLEDAFEYLGLFYISEYPYWHGGRFSETAALYVGNGFGLCANYTDTISCDEEKLDKRNMENILSISYTRSLLASTWSTQDTWSSSSVADIETFHDFGLGWDKRNDNSNASYYWEAVRDAIMKSILEASLHINKPEIFSADPVYSVARSAAEMFKRLCWDHKHGRGG
ncbi:hypothetical protein DL98DRAFT_539248 [Cadophora sp. DSE1049]|nr:hypothetical protein DL98DRAFT_539248 [Cadophora sp. DSE1049]